MSCRRANPSGLQQSTAAFRAPGSPNALRRSVPMHLRAQPVYSYVVTTIQTLPGSHLQQTGSAPNFAGARITLCTCKHKDRATFCPSGDYAKPWNDVWVAGLTRISSNPPWAVAYLMLVEEVFPDHYTIWSHLSRSCRNAKSASASPIGDIYEPKLGASANPHSPANYKTPVIGHVHAQPKDPLYWHGDIEMWTSKTQPHGRSHHLLLGDPEWSYQWLRARMRLQPSAMGKTAHHKIFPSLTDFILNLI